MNQRLALRKIILLLVVLSCSHYIYAQGTWQSKAVFGGGIRQMATGFSIGDKGYVATGFDGADKQDFWEYDPLTNAWTQKAAFPGSVRRLAAGFAIGNKGYIGTGYNGTYYNDFYEWDQAGNSWTQKTNFPGSIRCNASGFSIGAKGYITSGFGPSGTANDLWEWDQLTDTWTMKTAMPATPRGNLVSLVVGNKVYAGTGLSAGGAAFNDFWEWDQGSNAWTQKASMTAARWGAVGFVIGNWIYVATGQDGSSYFDDLWMYDHISNSWTQKANVTGSARAYAFAFTINNKGYLGSGADPTAMSDFMEYTSDSTVVSGVDEAVLQNDVAIYPSPATDVIHIASSFDIASLQLYDANGKMVLNKKGTAKEITADVKSLSNGVYTANIIFGNNTSVTRKITKISLDK